MAIQKRGKISGNGCLRCRWLFAAVLAALFIGFPATLRSEIKVVSYLLRDRAVVLDSMVMRKTAFFAFKSSKKLSEIKGSAMAGALSHDGKVMSRDTTWIFDEAAGNLGFSLPYEIPDGIYHLEIKNVSPAGLELDSYSGDFKREELQTFFKRTINYWDYTTPYGHLQCAGYGYITYTFNSDIQLKPGYLELTARMSSDSDFPVKASLSLNGVDLGKFELPSGEEAGPPKKVTWRVDDRNILSRASISTGKNTFTLAIDRENNTRGMGLRIFSKKNVPDPAIEDGVPIILKAGTGEGKGGEKVYTVSVWGVEGEHVNSDFVIPFRARFIHELPEEREKPLLLGKNDVRRGYVVFQRHYLRYVYPWTIPQEGERIDSLGMQASRNDFEPLTFAVYPLRDLGRVRVKVEDFQGPGGAVIPGNQVEIFAARTLKIRSGGSSYRLKPRLLDRANEPCVPIDYTTRFWLTVHVPENTVPGKYRSIIRIEPEKEPAAELPLDLEVLPITLVEVPGIAYSMFMSYEFFELDSKEWTPRERELIYRDGLNIFRDYRNHGMTTVDVSSPYYFQWNRDGSPRLEHLKTMIIAAKEVGFREPIFWYFAHYVQAAKHQHPGNILLYDPKIHTRRTKFLVETALQLDRSLGGPPIYFVPIDEPRVALRQKIAVELFQAVKEVPQTKVMSSTDIGGKFLDIENCSQMDKKRLGPGQKKRVSTRQVWEYHNEAIEAANPGFSRYIYGYYTWRQDLDGMNSWGPSTTENSRGNPFEDLDHESYDYMLFYPHPAGPLPSVNWEAIREGIDDVRYIYQLEKLIKEKGLAHPEEALAADNYLDALRAMCDIDEGTMISDFGDWTPEKFDRTREEVISWILKLSKL